MHVDDVSPQPISELRPTMITGTPGIVAPMTPPCCNSNRVRYQIDGAVRPRCGSLAIRVDPVAERLVPAAQPFDAPARGAGLNGAKAGQSGVVLSA